MIYFFFYQSNFTSLVFKELIVSCFESYFVCQVTVGREWYMHAIYTVKAVDQRRKRSVIYSYHSVRSSVVRSRREVAGLTDTIGEAFNRGTQMKHLKLLQRNRRSPADNPNESGNPNAPEESDFPILYVIIGAAVFVLLIAIVIAVVVVRRRNKKTPRNDSKGRYTGGKNIVVRKKQGGKVQTSVVSKRSSSGYSSSDTSEV